MKTTLALTALAAFALANAAHAAPIQGGISIFGVDKYTTDTVTFNGNGSIGAGTAYGDYSPTYDAGCNGCLAMTGFNFVSFSGPVKVYDGAGTSFTITGIDSYALGPNNSTLTVLGTGFAGLLGFDDTPGTFDFSTQGGASKFVTYSATAEVPDSIPEPASIVMLGAGLLGMGAIRRIIQK